MRPRFTDSKRLKARARSAAVQGDGGLERWWAKKYKLPIDHPLLQEQTTGGLLFEMYRDLADELEMLEMQIKTSGARERAVLNQRHRELSKILEVVQVKDDWETMMERGEIPDLTKYIKKAAKGPAPRPRHPISVEDLPDHVDWDD